MAWMIQVWALFLFCFFTAAFARPLFYMWVFTAFVKFQIYPSAVHKERL